MPLNITNMTERQFSTKAHSGYYRPDVDGLRALAILPVVLFHTQIACPGGYVGVDIFFVISGFLICTLIGRELGEGTFSLLNFWERRVRRILPALAVVVLATLVAGWLLYLPEDFAMVGRSVMAQAALMSNFFFCQQSGYFMPGSETQPLLHTWSLAVEEQFYLGFPLLLILFARCRWLPVSPAVLGLALGSLGLSVLWSHAHERLNFYLLPTRAWELLLGAGLALLRGKLGAGGAVREVAAGLGLGLIGYALFFYDATTRFPGLTAIPPCLGAALIIFSSEEKPSWLGRLLALKPVVFTGLISYSLYLWHWPVLVFARYLSKDAPGAGLKAILLSTSVALAILSWKYIEIPFRQRRVFAGRMQILGFGAGSTVALLALGLAVVHGHGFPARFPAQVLRWTDLPSHVAFRNEITPEQAGAGQFVELGSAAPNQPIAMLVWGDSHGMAATPVIDELCRRHHCRGIQATHSATPPILHYVASGVHSLKGESPAFASSVLGFIARNHVKNVVLAAYWSFYPATESLKSNLVATVRALQETGTRVYVLKDVPTPGFDVSRFAALTTLHQGNLAELGVPAEQYQMAGQDLNPTFSELACMGATLLDPAGCLPRHDGRYDVIQGGQLLYWDSHHLTVEGSRLLTPLFEPIFQRP